MKYIFIVVVLVVLGFLVYQNTVINTVEEENDINTVHLDTIDSTSDIDKNSIDIIKNVSDDEELIYDVDVSTQKDTNITQPPQEVVTTSDPEESETKVFTVSGFNFGFNIDKIEVNEGDTVTINFTSIDGFHDWVVDEFEASTERVQTGKKTSVTFVASKKGTYEYYCSVGSHRANGMVGKLIVK